MMDAASVTETGPDPSQNPSPGTRRRRHQRTRTGAPLSPAGGYGRGEASAPGAVNRERGSVPLTPVGLGAARGRQGGRGGARAPERALRARAARERGSGLRGPLRYLTHTGRISGGILLSIRQVWRGDKAPPRS